MKITTPQLITLLFGIILIVGMGLYPPWRVELGFYSPSRRACAYGSLFSPPHTVRIDPEPEAEPVICRAIGLDMSRLLVQWAVVALAVAGTLVGQELGTRCKQEN